MKLRANGELLDIDPRIHPFFLVQVGINKKDRTKKVGYSRMPVAGHENGTVVFFDDDADQEKLVVQGHAVVWCKEAKFNHIMGRVVEMVTWNGLNADAFMAKWMEDNQLKAVAEPPVLHVREDTSVRRPEFKLADVRVVPDQRLHKLPGPPAPPPKATPAPAPAPVEPAGPLHIHEDRGNLFKLRKGYFHFWPVGFNSFSPNPAVRFTCIVWKKDEAKPRQPTVKEGRHAYQLLFEAQRDASDMGLQFMWPEDWKLVGHKSYE